MEHSSYRDGKVFLGKQLATVCVAVMMSLCASAQTPQPGSTLQVVARRVVVDVVVTDIHGKPVRGLTRDDFKISEDGTPQSLRSFDAHVLEHRAGPPPPLPKLDLPPDTYANLVQAPEDGPVTVILYDVLNTPANVMPYAHAAMVKFIKNQPPGSRTAIFVLGTRLRMLEGFTDDETRLLAAINSKSAGTQQSSLLLNQSTSGNAPPDLTADNPNVPTDPTAVGPTTILGQLNNMETMEQVMQYRERIFATAEAFAEIARYLSSLPGRKNMLWLSGSFPGSVLPNTDLAVSGTSNEFGMTINADREIKIANDLLNAAHVSVYPIDVRGLQVDTFYSAANNAKLSPSSPPKMNTFSNNLNAEHSTMDTIADNTGGHAFYNTNGLGQAMQTAIDQGSVYYTLTYTPSNPKFDGGVRHIKVQLDKDGYNLSYRKTYYAENASLEAGTPGKTNTPVPEGTQAYDPMTALMKHGAPISSELFFEASVVPVGSAVPATAKEAAQLGQFAAKPTAREIAEARPVMVQHYEVSFFILGRLLEMPELSNGKYDLKLGFGLAAFDADGLLQNGIEIQYNDPVSAAEHDKIKASAYRTKLPIAVPLDARWIRIAVRNASDGHTGTLEVPVKPAAKP